MAIQRKLYQKLEKHLSKKEFTIIIGPRQVGKTTLLKQLYEKVKKEKQSAVILSLEDPEIKAQINAHPDNVFKYIPKPTSKNKVYLFIDEVQYAKDPSHFLKYLFDHYAPSLKVIVMLPELENDEVPFEGLKVTVGAVVSLLKNVEVGVVPNPESPE